MLALRLQHAPVVASATRQSKASKGIIATALAKTADDRVLAANLVILRRRPTDGLAQAE